MRRRTTSREAALANVNHGSGRVIDRAPPAGRVAPFCSSRDVHRTICAEIRGSRRRASNECRGCRSDGAVRCRLRREPPGLVDGSTGQQRADARCYVVPPLRGGDAKSQNVRVNVLRTKQLISTHSPETQELLAPNGMGFGRARHVFHRHARSLRTCGRRS